MQVPEVLAKDLVLELPVTIDTRNAVVEGRVSSLDPAVRKVFFEAYKDIENLWEILSPSPELRDTGAGERGASKAGRGRALETGVNSPDCSRFSASSGPGRSAA